MAALRCRSSQTYINQLLESGRYLDVYGQRLFRTSNDCLNTAQTTIHSLNRPKNIHSGSKSNSDDKNNSNVTQANSKSNFLDLNKMKENVLGAISTISIELPDFKKVIPWKTKTDNTAEKSHATKIYQMKKSESVGNDKMKKTVASVESDVEREKHSLEGHVESINDSIISFYDTSAVDLKNNKGSPEQTESQKMATTSKDESTNATEAKTDDESVLWRIFGYASSFTPGWSESAAKNQVPVVRKDFVSKADIDMRTRSLVRQVKVARSDVSRFSRMENLCEHLLEYPDARNTAYKEKVVPCLLKLQKSREQDIQAKASEALSLVGYVAPPRGHGIRALTIDGGGTRGLVALKTLKKLEEVCNTEVWKLFDYVCGVSTGSLMCVMVFLYKLPLDEVERRYIDCSRRMFTRNKLVGTGTLFRTHAFYDTDVWEQILLENFGKDKTTSEFSVDPLCPKMSAISCITNIPKMKNYMFRTYNLPPGVYSHYPGNCKHKIWEMIRASTAAPGYYEQFNIGDYVYQDGGLMANNPTAVAVHECKLLWPDEPLQCVVSLGNGRYEPSLEVISKKTITIREKVTKIIEVATDTEDVHRTLEDLLPPSTYYRFNPYMSEDLQLDTIESEKLLQMNQDTEMYLRKNEHKVNKAKEQLLLPRQKHKKVIDYVKWKADTIEFKKPF